MIKPVRTEVIGKAVRNYYSNGRFVTVNKNNMIKNWGVEQRGQDIIKGKISGTPSNYTIYVQDGNKLQKSFVRKPYDGKKEVYTIMIDKIANTQTKIYSLIKKGAKPIIKKSVSNNTNMMDFYWSGAYIR